MKIDLTLSGWCILIGIVTVLAVVRELGVLRLLKNPRLLSAIRNRRHQVLFVLAVITFLAVDYTVSEFRRDLGIWRNAEISRCSLSRKEKESDHDFSVRRDKAKIDPQYAGCKEIYMRVIFQ